MQSQGSQNPRKADYQESSDYNIKPSIVEEIISLKVQRT